MMFSDLNAVTRIEEATITTITEACGAERRLLELGSFVIREFCVLSKEFLAKEF